MSNSTADNTPRTKVEHHLGLVFRVANSCSRYLEDGRLDRNDLVNWGTIGLYEAWKRFDPDRGFAFGTYAVPYIHGEILNGMKKLRREVWNAKRRGVTTRRYSFDAP